MWVQAVPSRRTHTERSLRLGFMFLCHHLKVHDSFYQAVRRGLSGGADAHPYTAFLSGKRSWRAPERQHAVFPQRLP